MTDLVSLFQRAAVMSSVNEGVPAIVGRRDGVTTYVDPAGTTQPHKCWVQLGEDKVETVVTNTKVPHVPGAPVRVADRHGVPTVISEDSTQANVWAANGSNINTPTHRHDRKSSNPDYIESLRFLPLLVWPSTPLAMTVTVNPGTYWWQGTPRYFDGGTSGSLSSYIPASGNLRHFVIVAIDRSDGTIAIIDGSDAGNPLIAVNVTMEEVAAIAIADKYLPLAVVQFYAGQTTVRLTDIVFDLRPFNGNADVFQLAGEDSSGASPRRVTLYLAGVDLETVADYVVAIPDGRLFWPDEIGIICDTLDTLTTQPTIRAGIEGSEAKWLAATTTTELTAANKRETFTPLTPEDGETTVSFGVTTAATVTSMTGTFYATGILK